MYVKGIYLQSVGSATGCGPWNLSFHALSLVCGAVSIVEHSQAESLWPVPLFKHQPRFLELSAYRRSKMQSKNKSSKGVDSSRLWALTVMGEHGVIQR